MALASGIACATIAANGTAVAAADTDTSGSSASNAGGSDSSASAATGQRTGSTQHDRPWAKKRSARLGGDRDQTTTTRPRRPAADEQDGTLREARSWRKPVVRRTEDGGAGDPPVGTSANADVNPVAAEQDSNSSLRARRLSRSSVVSAAITMPPTVTAAATPTPSAPAPAPTTPTLFSMLTSAWRDLTRKGAAPTVPSQQVSIMLPTSTAVSGSISFNANDPDGDSLTYSVPGKGTAAGPKYGTVTIDQATGTFVYDPVDTLTTGTITDTFTVTVSDGTTRTGLLAFLRPSTGNTSSATVTVVVGPANQVPTAVSDSLSVIADSPASGNVLTNDTDPDGQPLTATLISDPRHGTVDFHADGSFTYTPERNFTGTDTFSYVATDGSATSAVATVTLTVATVPTGKTPTIGSQGITWWAGLTAEDADRALSMARAAGVTSMRIDITWYVVEMTQGTYDFSMIDLVVDKMVEHDMTILGMLYDTPAWLSGSPNPHTPPDPALFAQFAAATAQHYLGEIDMWEIWNEPNIPRFWTTPDPVAYAELLQAVYPAIKAVSSTATIVAGGLSPDSSGIDPVTFVTAMYNAGAGGYFDALALHPYSFPQFPTLNSIEAVHDVMVANGDGAKQIWLTEVGAPTGTSPWAMSEADQAQAIAMYIDFARYNDYIGPVYLYSLLDTGTDPANPEDNFGLIRRDFTPKPALGVWL